MRLIECVALFGVSLWFCAGQPLSPALAESSASIRVVPQEIHINGPFDRLQLVITAPDGSGQFSPTSRDLTREATFPELRTDLIAIDSQGQITGRRNGTAELKIVAAGATVVVPVHVSGMDAQPEVDFLKDVRPVLGKAGCAAGACHAAQHGKGGFKLSVFGFDPVADYESIVVNSRGRRINPASPDSSLILDKATMRTAHVGGLRIDANSLDYQLVRRWISAGSKPSKMSDIAVSHLTVFPEQRVCQPRDEQQLRVVAEYSDGSSRDVTALAMYDSIDVGVAQVSRSGQVTAAGRGQTAIMVRYEGQAAISTFVVPYAGQPSTDAWQSENYVDELAAAKFADIGLQPSGVCDDATFIRRAFLDAIGGLPDPDTVVAFLESQDPKKRQQLVDRLLGLTGNPEWDIYNDRYAAFWTLRWSDLIRNNSSALGEQGMWALHNWIRDSFRVNKRFDQFVQELVTAKGSIYSNGPANFFRVHGDASALTEATSQLFMGMRLECAKCHQHPFESISQTDYYSMSAFFSRVASKNSEEFGLFGRETIVMVKPTGEAAHPRTGKRLPPRPLGGETTEHDLDRRLPLAAWLTSKDNPYFARSIVNRYVDYLLGHGLVEPVDDMRSTNPPSNAALIDALADDFVKHDFDLKHLMRTIMVSRLYSLSSQPTAENANDRRFYSHFAVKRLAAEPLLDAIDQATGVTTKFKDLPLGTRAIELPDAEYPDHFLNTFAKPRRVSVCECERAPDANLAQALHTLNGDTLATKIAAKDGRIAKLVAAKKPEAEAVRELYLAALCRLPSPAELQESQQIVSGAANPTEGYQDLLWALINSKQFLFVH